MRHKKQYIDLTETTRELRDTYNRESMKSLKRMGISPYNDLTKLKHKPNFVISPVTIRNTVCLNYFNLQDISPQEVEDALKVGVWEEYYGIIGISLERAWPLHHDNREFICKEFQQRMSSNIVFVLKPPMYHVMQSGIVRGSMKNEGAPVGVYTNTKDWSNYSFAATRGNPLIHPTVRTSRMTEMKVSIKFSLKEHVLAILVPENLHKTALKEFKEDFNVNQIICVKEKEFEIVRVPQTLTMLQKDNGEYVRNSIKKNRVKVKLPDYEKALAKIAKEHPRFSLHAVRLYSELDFMPRYIHNIKNHRDFITSHGGKIGPIESDGSGWAIVHKSIGVSLLPSIRRISTAYV